MKRRYSIVGCTPEQIESFGGTNIRVMSQVGKQLSNIENSFSITAMVQPVITLSLCRL